MVWGRTSLRGCQGGRLTPVLPRAVVVDISSIWALNAKSTRGSSIVRSSGSRSFSKWLCEPTETLFVPFNRSRDPGPTMKRVWGPWKSEGHTDVVPMHVRQDDVIDFVGCQTASSERGNNIRVRAHRLTGRDVLADWSGVGVWFAAKAKVEKEAGPFGDLRMGGVLDQEGKGWDCESGRWGIWGDEEALGEGEVAGREGVDGHGSLSLGCHGVFEECVSFLARRWMCQACTRSEPSCPQSSGEAVKWRMSSNAASNKVATPSSHQISKSISRLMVRANNLESSELVEMFQMIGAQYGGDSSGCGRDSGW